MQPGDLILIKRQGSVEDIIGFGTVYCRMPAFTSTIWKRYGPASGAADAGELEMHVARRRTRPSVADPVIGNIIINDPILFPDRPFKLYQQSAVQNGHQVWTSLSGKICEELVLQLSGHAYHVQLAEAPAPPPTATAVGATDLRFLAWEDAVRTAYDSTCAVTKVRARAILRASAIQPLALGGPLNVSNGILLELDLATLYEKQLIAFHLNGTLLVSPDLALEDPKLYGELAGRMLKCPKRVDDQPALDLVHWRLDNHFNR